MEVIQGESVEKRNVEKRKVAIWQVLPNELHSRLACFSLEKWVWYGRICVHVCLRACVRAVHVVGAC